MADQVPTEEIEKSGTQVSNFQIEPPARNLIESDDDGADLEEEEQHLLDPKQLPVDDGKDEAEIQLSNIQSEVLEGNLIEADDDDADSEEEEEQPLLSAEDLPNVEEGDEKILQGDVENLQEARARWGFEVKANLLEAMTTFLDELYKKVLDLQEETEASAAILRNLPRNHCVMSKDLAGHCETIWKDPAIQLMVRNSNRFYVYEGMEYFMSKIREFTDGEYLPT
jgi:hypothetical protein